MAVRRLSSRRRIFLALILGALLGGQSFDASAENWQAKLYEEGSPSRLVGVDKKKGNFFYFEKKSPLKVRYSYPCVTGQLAGDKQQINDLRTPEGVYFVEYKIASGLDFREYGGIAYTLNYPNPVDRLRGKTGHGIWIHSKGFELVPTKGCVAIGLNHIREVGPSLLPGTPVVLAWELDGAPKEKNDVARSLVGLMKEWSRAWAAKSPKMFEYYDETAYTRATENFSLFRQNKERLFKILNFIKIYNREIHVLEGPGYWVTWAEQFYSASNLSTEGVRRLYWQKGDDGKFRIVGMEWTPRDVGMRADFLQGRLVAEAASQTASDASSEKPVAPRLDMPEMSAEEKSSPLLAVATQPVSRIPQKVLDADTAAGMTAQKPAQPILEKGNDAQKASPPRASVMELAKNLMLAISEPLVPKRPPEIDQPAEILWGAGDSIDERNRTKATDEPASPFPAAAPTTNSSEAGSGGELSGSGAPKAVQEDDRADLKRLGALAALERWDRAFKARDVSLEQLYDRASYNRVKNAPRGFSYGQAMIDLRRQFAKPWIRVISRPWRMEMHDDLAAASCSQLIASPVGIEQGERKLWLKEGPDGEWRIVASSFTPKNVGLYPDYLETVSADIGATLENWRKAWQKGKVDEYIAHYAPNAVQQGRQGAQNIRRQKENLWSRAKPASVQLSGLRLTLEKQGVRADMAQNYKDSNGVGDKGIKTLILRYDGDKWLITREDWVKNGPQARLAMP